MDLEGNMSMDVLLTLQTLCDHPRDIDLWIGLIAENTDNDFLLGQKQRCKFSLV